MAAHASFAKGQLLVAAQTFSVDEGRASDQLALCTFLRLEPGNGPFPKVPPLRPRVFLLLLFHPYPVDINTSETSYCFKMNIHHCFAS